jgi:hypothetical protein
MKDLYEKTNFLLDGGILVLLSEYLSERISRGLIVRPEGSDLAVLDAFGTPMESLFLEDAANSLGSVFPSPPLRTPFEVLSAPLAGEWSWAVRLRGTGWCFYVLLGEEPSQELMEEMPAFAGLINLWQLHQKTAGVEERLSRLAYMVLATKNTLASVFEPMGIHYFAAFLHDVVNESLFPNRFSLILDDGETLSLLEGEEMLLPPRKGIFARDILSPVPIRVEEAQRELLGHSVFDSLAEDWSAVLPIPGGAFRLFCFLKWEETPGEEAFNFMELLGNVASKALSLTGLREEREKNISELSRRAFLLNALHEAAMRFMEQSSMEDLLLQILDIFSEMAQAPRSLIVVWQPAAGGYVHLASKNDGVLEKKGTFAGFPVGLLEGDRPGSFSPEEGKRIFAFMEVPALASVEGLDGMDRIFPLWDGDRMTAFVGVSSSLAGTDTMDIGTLESLARTASVAMRKNEWDSGHLAAGKYLNLAALADWETARVGGEIRADGGIPVFIKGPGAHAVSSEQERFCRLVIRSECATLCIAESSVPRLGELFPAAEGWIMEMEEMR